MDYKDMSKEDFDAIVTGELTHISLSIEDEINNIICDYFIKSGKKIDFKRLILFRDGLTFHDKIEILRAMVPLFGEVADRIKLKIILREVENFKLIRNAMSHGLDVSNSYSNILKVEIISRSGKPKIIEITPESHKSTYEHGDQLLDKIRKARIEIKKAT